MAKTVHIIAEDSSRLSGLRVMLETTFAVTGALLKRPMEGPVSDALVIAVDLRVADNISVLKQTFARATVARRRVFLIDRRDRLLVLQAHALGATHVLFSPAVAHDLCRALADPAESGTPDDPHRSDVSRAASRASEALSSMFSSILCRHRIDVAAATSAAGRVADSIAEDGLSAWLDAVRQHHEGTYQHCLLVIGIVVDFGRSLGLGAADVQRLYSAAMFHDIGKAAIPAAILDKPGKLDVEERRLVETHPSAGHSYLQQCGDISREVLDAVRHHHEYLDGSGYPDGLEGDEISDVVRIVTISDIFAALIERRSYKPPMSRPQAFDVLLGMRGKLEMPLVRAFKEVALHR